MSASSVAVYNRWRDLMRSWGFTVLEAAGCDTQSASSRAVDPSGMFLEHHDASSILSGNWGSLATILAGRPGIPPRLGNLQYARDGQVMIVCKNVANHGGMGGPLLGVPANDVNVHSCGAEVANNGLGEPYSPALTRAIIHGEAAWAIVTGRTAKFIRGHKEWAPGRKSDPVLDMDVRRAAVAAIIDNGGPLVPSLEEELMAQVKTAVVIGSPSSGPHKDKVVAFYLLSGIVRHLPSQLAVDKTKMWLGRAGIPFEDVGEIDLPEAFGDLSQLDRVTAA